MGSPLLLLQATATVPFLSLSACRKRGLNLNQRPSKLRFPMLLRASVREEEEPETISSRSWMPLPFSSYGMITGVASVGLMETLYLTFAKLSGESVACPLGGSSCSDVLNSDYATVLGVPLSAVGAIAYGTVALLGIAGLRNIEVKEKNLDLLPWLLLGSASAMASASTYFMYILYTKLEGASCAYCVASALLSFSLLLLSLRSFHPREIKQVAGIQLAVAASVIVALSTAYRGSLDSTVGGFSNAVDMLLPPVEAEVTTTSGLAEVALAKHLHSIGAKMYGAFWCSHCYEQKQMFGSEAMKYLDYVECYPDGYKQGMRIAKDCDIPDVKGFPTWIIQGKVFSGEQKLSDIAEISGFTGFEPSSTLSD